MANVILESSIPGLDLVPANSEMGMAERFLPSRQGYEFILKRAFSQLANPYDFILLDCPPFLGSVTLNALSSIDLLLIPTQAEFFSIYALRNLMALVRRVRSQYNPNLKYRLLLTMVDRRNKTHRIMSEQLRTTFTTGVMQTVIETDTKLRESPIAGVPIIQHAPKSRASAPIPRSGPGDFRVCQRNQRPAGLISFFPSSAKKRFLHLTRNLAFRPCWTWETNEQGYYLVDWSEVEDGLDYPAFEWIGQSYTSLHSPRAHIRTLQTAQNNGNFPCEIEVEFLDKKSNPVLVRMNLFSRQDEIGQTRRLARF